MKAMALPGLCGEVPHKEWGEVGRGGGGVLEEGVLGASVPDGPQIFLVLLHTVRSRMLVERVPISSNKLGVAQSA